MRRTVVVVGMHRSGTSAITASLPLLGVQIGREEEHLPPAEPQNSKGFFELRQIVEFNDRILTALGMAWCSLNGFPTGWEQLPEILALKQEIQSYITHRFGSEPLWGFKDPRVSRLLPLWEDVLTATGSLPLYLIVVRHPWSVAQSLYQRDGFPIDIGMQLWMSHVAKIIMHTARHSRVIVDYDLFLESPDLQLVRIANGLGLALTEDKKELASYTENFLDRNLRHHGCPHQMLGSHPEIPDQIRDTDMLLWEAANDRISGDRLTTDFFAIHK